MHPERKPAAAVVFDVLGDRVRAVALGEEKEEIAAVKIIPVERKAAPSGVHFAQRTEPAGVFRAHLAFEMALPEAAVPLVPVGLRIDGKAFGQPTGLQQIWKRARKERKENSGQHEKSAEYSPKDERRALCLIQMNDVGEFVREHELQPQIGRASCR